MALWNKQKILHDHRRTISWLLLGMERFIEGDEQLYWLCGKST